jgi:hypothetical protein
MRKIFELFDRFMVTWLFAIFDIVVLLPMLLFLAAFVTGTVLIFVVRFASTLSIWHTDGYRGLSMPSPIGFGSWKVHC